MILDSAQAGDVFGVNDRRRGARGRALAARWVALLLSLAVDAESRLGARAQPLRVDRPAALLADPVGPAWRAHVARSRRASRSAARPFGRWQTRRPLVSATRAAIRTDAEPVPLPAARRFGQRRPPLRGSTAGPPGATD